MANVFDYDPKVNDERAKYIEKMYEAEADKTRATGQTVAQVGNALADALGTYASKKNEIAMMDGVMEVAAKKGLVDAETLNKYLQADIGKKRGFFTPTLYELQSELRRGEQFTPSAEMLDLPDGRKVPYVTASRNHVQFLDENRGTATQQDMTGPAISKNGKFWHDGVRWREREDESQGTGMTSGGSLIGVDQADDSYRDQEIRKLERDLEYLDTEIGKRGENAKDGPDILPWADSLGERREKVKGQLERLQHDGQTSRGSGGSPTGGAGKQEYATDKEVQAAYMQGILTYAEAERILKDQFGYSE